MKAKSTTKKAPATKKPAAKKARPLPHVKKPVALEPTKSTHLILVLDNSASFRDMQNTRNHKVADLIDQFVSDGESHDIKTYVSIYYFGQKISCVAQHTGPVMAKMIEKPIANENGTALYSGVKRAINDNIKRLSSPSEDIAQIMYVLTDGQENFSSAYDDTYWTEVKALVESLNDDWTVIAMVPRKQQATFTKIGFAPGNILEWDTTNEGLDIGTQSVTRSSVQYTAQRSAGVKKSVNYFQADFKKITADNIAKEAKRLSKRDFYIAQNGEQVMEMRPMIEATGGEYVEGNHFYALIKNETVQPQKKLVVIDKSTGYAYGGDGIRKLLGLPNSPVMMTPAFSPAYDIFVQSSAPNRKIMPTQKVFCLKEKSK